jgi:hypothetical protein
MIILFRRQAHTKVIFMQLQDTYNFLLSVEEEILKALVDGANSVMSTTLPSLLFRKTSWPCWKK